ncbi:hypothetical protein A2634_01125 [Candidatus Amesbacteria bacterium RIFCSPHIGHO2_01_FULL_48_32]|uniref:Thymidylate kinase-like domain-containing protein n=1 Tax=Candidatus Amesbacteria bacterium RIFCSPLOWO2_01_FULL_48_25 TaxID=1797259 RepID=A0A1F4ZBJ9_9BACT|nr:MAG: hypothetical protein A2634_01125 [Candidatus Amesbacteria bacterium RIFCSPHIGHO2_01_FULL_48_32]OGD03643.1 MAG: hypothetical protein A2989_03110 [Candidatus Amesbacteria bacterium RIFCSPLOWO2_01_FULL_48_25]HJZ06011.1 hypothetical protein [Patescibacteria group bacterium]
MKKGLFVVLYGPDGVGKSRQMELIEERLREQGVMYRRLRYPIYDLKPTGSRLDEMLHKNKKPLEEEKMQELFAQNRRDFEPTLRSWLNSGVCVAAENYTGTGLAWGAVRGVAMIKLEEMNKGILEPDVAIFLDGPKRAELPIEGHPYGTEENEDEWYRLRKIYLQLADKYGWVRVGGDAPILIVANRIWAVVRPVLVRR